jgi:uncharacterized protein
LVFCAACQRVPESPVPFSGVDSQIAAEIASIKAIDNHAHPVRPTATGEAPDRDFDALPVDNLEPPSDPIRLRAGSPEVREAHQALGKIDNPVQVLDRLGIDILIANRVSMGPGLPSDRFRWVPYADALMYPLSNESMIHNSDQRAFFALEEKLLGRYYADLEVAARPARLDDYLMTVVRPTLERQKRGGAVAEKFEMAYLRPLDVSNPSKAQAEAAWERHRVGSVVPRVPGDARGEYKAVQDYIFRFIAAECGRLGMAVHIHTGAGAGSYFDVAGVNPMLFEPLVDDPALRQTNFVFLHGDWPYAREVTALLTKPNAYLDFSDQDLILYPAEMAATIRRWIEFVPEKVLFGTDAYPYSTDLGWAESGYIAAKTGRAALGLALTGMLEDGEISRPRALELARMVLRDNARALYKLP